MGWHDDLTIERKRIKATQDEVSRVIRPIQPATPKRLVQVFTAGTLPTCTPCYYLGHPTELDGDEQEGDSATPSVDTSRTIPFVLLNGSVNVGDVLPVFGVGGRWVAEQGGSSSCKIRACITYTGCDGTWPINNVSVVSSGGGGCVTGVPNDIGSAGAGCCYLDTPGTITFEIAGCTATPTAACGDTVGCTIISPPPPGYFCCSQEGFPGCLIPYTLHVTDANGTHTANYNATDGLWEVAYSVTKSTQGNWVDGADPCISGGGGQACFLPGTGDVQVSYGIQCTTGGLLVSAVGPFCVIQNPLLTSDLRCGTVQVDAGCQYVCPAAPGGGVDCSSDCVTTSPDPTPYYTPHTTGTLGPITQTSFSCSPAGGVSWTGTNSNGSGCCPDIIGPTITVSS